MTDAIFAEAREDFPADQKKEARHDHNQISRHFTDDERKDIAASREAVGHMKRTFEVWMQIARGVEACYGCSRRVPDVTGAFYELLKEADIAPVLGNTQSSVVSQAHRLREILKREADVLAWRKTLSPLQLIQWSSPSAIYKHCPVWRTEQKAKATSATKVHNDTLQSENKALKEQVRRMHQEPPEKTVQWLKAEGKLAEVLELGSAELPGQAEVERLKREHEEELAKWKAAYQSMAEKAAYFEAAHSGVFDAKAYKLIRDCLHPDNVNEGERSESERARYTKAFVAFNEHEKALRKPTVKEIEQVQSRRLTAEEMFTGEGAMRRRGEVVRQNKERAQKAAATRKANKQPKRELEAAAAPAEQLAQAAEAVAAVEAAPEAETPPLAATTSPETTPEPRAGFKGDALDVEAPRPMTTVHDRKREAVRRANALGLHDLAEKIEKSRYVRDLREAENEMDQLEADKAAAA